MVPSDLERRQSDARIKRLCGEHRTRLVQLLIRKGCSPDDAEDIAEESILKTFEHFSVIDPRHDRSYLFVVAVNRLYAVRRSERHTAELHDHIPSPSAPTAAEIVQRIVESEAVDKFIAALGRNARLALYHELVDEMTSSQSAEAMGLSESALKSLKNRARQRVRSRFTRP